MPLPEIGLFPEIFPEYPDMPETAIETLLLLDASFESKALKLLWFCD
jgi:hypothetical protein